MDVHKDTIAVALAEAGGDKDVRAVRQDHEHADAVVAVERVGLKDAGVTGQVPLGMLASPIARGVEQRRRRVLPAERPIVCT